MVTDGSTEEGMEVTPLAYNLVHLSLIALFCELTLDYLLFAILHLFTCRKTLNKG